MLPRLFAFALVGAWLLGQATAAAAPAGQAAPTYRAGIVPPALSKVLGGETYSVPVSVTNMGTAPWNAAGAGAVALSSHWLDASGNVVIWDGPRSPLSADVAPGATVTITARITAPTKLGAYTLVLDLVREGVAWFGSLGSTPTRVAVSVAPITFAASYSVAASAAAYVGETRGLTVSVTNSGNVAWGGSMPVRLAYHIHNAKGDPVIWDGERVDIGDLAPGATKQVTISYQAPSQLGDYVLSIDALREGIAWFSSLGTAPLRLPMKVDSGYTAGYGATNMPTQATIGARVPVRVQVDNYGPRPLVSRGANPVTLGYHIFDRAGRTVVWDGQRGLLPFDVPPMQSALVDVEVQLPSTVGEYVIAWDLVQEGVAWLSSFGIKRKQEAVSVLPGVTFYGKGFGHGLGMSQYGAQGMATGAGGTPPKTGEQIVAYYYPGTQLSPVPAGAAIRVLLSQPSSQGRYSCGAAYFAGSSGSVSSDGGMRVIDDGAGGATITTTAPNAALRLAALGGGTVQAALDQGGAVIYQGPGPLRLAPIDPGKPLGFAEKGIYRGDLRFTDLGGTLRVINLVSFDDYVRGVVPLEMLKDWHLEAYKAQAIAARTYAYNSLVPARDYDVLDDQSDQCYGGTKMRSGRVVETEATNRAVDLTLGKVITYNGAAIRAYFSSSDGGYTKAVGCWNDNVKTIGGKPQCGDSPPYLTPVPDPWDLAVQVPTANRNASWQVTFTSDQVRSAVLAMRGIDIGSLLSVDLSNRQPAEVGHVVSVRVVGTRATVDLPADRFLRERLFLRSTMVRLAPW